MKYVNTITSVSIHSDEDNPVFGNSAIHIKIEDEAAGAYLVISQCSDENQGHVTVDFEQFEEMIKAVDLLKRQVK